MIRFIAAGLFFLIPPSWADAKLDARFAQYMAQHSKAFLCKAQHTRSCKGNWCSNIPSTDSALHIVMEEDGRGSVMTRGGGRDYMDNKKVRVNPSMPFRTDIRFEANGYKYWITAIYGGKPKVMYEMKFPQKFSLLEQTSELSLIGTCVVAKRTKDFMPLVEPYLPPAFE